MFTIDMSLLAQVLVSLAAALVMSFILTPVVKIFAQKVGAMDVPKDGRRMHDHPIPRLGGLAMFLGFLVSTLPRSSPGTRGRCCWATCWPRCP